MIMTVHSNAKILKAYADNTDLVIFIRDSNSKWIRTNPKALMDYPDDEFFACLPKHEKAILSGLNGGSYQVKCLADFSRCWLLDPEDWRDKDIWYMLESHESRLEPRKEKRWICITDNLEIEDVTIYESYADADENSPGHKQIVEIEVEV